MTIFRQEKGKSIEHFIASRLLTLIRFLISQRNMVNIMSLKGNILHNISKLSVNIFL